MSSAHTFCNACETFKDADKCISTEGFKHHSSYKALCDAAASGCSLCQLFKNSARPSRSRKEFTSEYKEDDPLASIFLGRPIQTISEGDECFDILSYWMEKCRTEHPLCSEAKDSTLPTRVIDGGLDSREPFLYTTNGKMGQWVSLSHCWGDYTPSRTTLATAKQNEVSLPLQNLQNNLQDAILSTRRLGFQYICIDALCIIQDSVEDWAHEASHMHEIYFGASLNISAMAATSGREGIFGSGNKDRFHMKSLFHFQSYSQSLNVWGTLSIRMKAGEFPMTPISSQPLYQRG